MSTNLRVLLIGAYPTVGYSASLAAIQAAVLSDQTLQSHISLKVLVLRLVETDLSKHWVGMGSNDLPILIDDVIRFEPDVVGLSCYPWNFRLFDILATSIKEVRPHTVVIAGGPAASSLKTSNGCDILLEGEGEERFLSLLKAIIDGKSQEVKNIPGLFIKTSHGFEWTGNVIQPVDIEKAPSGLLATSDHPLDVIFIETSRGCPLQCVFCCWGKGEKLKYVPLERVFREIDVLYRSRVQRVFLLDSAFNLNYHRANEILEYMIANHNGVTQFSFELWIESLQSTTAKLIGELAVKKGIDMCGAGLQTIAPEVTSVISRPFQSSKFRAGFRLLKQMAPAAPITLDVMFGLPQDSVKSVLKTLEYCINIGADRLNIFRCVVSPGSLMAQNPEAFGIMSQQYPPHWVTDSPSFQGNDLTAFSVFAMHWRQIAFRYGTTLRFISQITDGHAAEIGWDVFCQRRGVLDEWPAIGIKEWGLDDFEPALLRAYEQTVEAKYDLCRMFAQIVTFDKELYRKRPKAIPSGYVIVALVGSEITTLPQNDRIGFVVLSKSVVDFVRNGELTDTNLTETTVEIGYVEADQLSQLSLESLLFVQA